MIGQTLAHYRITEKIGAGGMGEVYRATDSRLHRDVAIKVLPAALAGDRDRMARFEREAQVLASLTHPSIAAVFGLEDAQGGKALVMELVEGEDLSDRLRRGPMPIEEAARTAAQIAEALDAAHEQGIIHRDLKPANIKLLPDGHVKLLDFGLAKALEGAGATHLTAGESATLSLAATQAGIILGTAAYMSPEQATGGVVDRRADVWSFGVVLFEMMTGRRLFDGQTTSHVLTEVIRAEVDFSKLPPATPRELRTILERCLERDPRRRLRDIREARLVLERMAEQTSSERSLLRTPVAAPVSAPGWRERVTWGAIGGVVIGIGVAAAAFWMRPSPPAAPLTRLEARLADDSLFTNVGAAFDISSDGRWIVLATGDAAGTEAGALRVRRLSELDSTMLVSTDSGANIDRPYNPFFSPDGTWIGYATPSELRKVPIGGGTPLTICRVNLSRGASWGPDGSIVFAPAPDSGLSRVPAAGGEPQPLTKLDASRKEATHRWPQVLPGGGAALFTSHVQAAGGFEGASIEVVILETGDRKVVQSGGSYGRYVPSGHLVYVHETTLFAVPFDLDRLEAVGQPVPVVQNITASAVHGAAQIAFSSTGLLAYLQGAAAVPVHPIVWVDRSGRDSPLLDEPGTYANPRLSPDGQRLSLTVLKNNNWDIWVHDLERRVSTRVTFDEAADTEQVWSPDGRELVFVSERRETGIFRKSADGSGVETVVGRADAGTRQDVWFPQAWSPDGKLLAFTSARGDIGVLPLGGDSKPSVFLDSRFAETDPAFSPDGRWLAYASEESGQPEIYVRRFPSGTGRAQISDGGGAYPRWSKKGAELIYRTSTGLTAVPVELGAESLRSGQPRELFRREFLGGIRGVQVGQYTFADYDVMPDGSRFVMFPRVASAPDTRVGMVTLVFNWFDELSRTAARGR